MVKKPKTPVKLSGTDDYKAVIRYIHLHTDVDRLGLSFVTGLPFGTVSRIISTLANEGYLAKHIGARMVYDRRYVDHELFMIDTPDKGRHLNWNYGNAQRRGRATGYTKSIYWDQFMKRYSRFLKTGKDPGRNYRG